MRQSEKKNKKRNAEKRLRPDCVSKKVQWNTHRAEMQHFMLDFRIKDPPLSAPRATAAEQSFRMPVYKMTPKVHSIFAFSFLANHGPRQPGGHVTAELSALTGATLLAIFTTSHSSRTERKLFSKLACVLPPSACHRCDLSFRGEAIRRLRPSGSTLRIQGKDDVRSARRSAVKNTSSASSRSMSSRGKQQLEGENKISVSQRYGGRCCQYQNIITRI